MSIRNVLNRNLNLKSLWLKFASRQKNRQLNLQSVTFLRNDNCCSQIVDPTQLFRNNFSTLTTGINSWKWLLAISLVYASYDGISEFKVFIVMLLNTVFFLF